MKTTALLLIVMLAGCSKSAQTVETKTDQAPAAADNPMGQLLYKHWQLQVPRIKDSSVFSATDPQKWMIEYSSRTYRMLTMGRADSAELLVPVALTTDMNFMSQPQPSDLPILDAIDWETQYYYATQICISDLRLRGLNKEAAAVETHANLLK